MDSKELYTDDELFRLISEGDGKAFTKLFDRYFEQLKWNAFKLLKSEFWAEEAVQEVFMQIWTGREKLVAVTSPAAYLFRVTANRCFDRIRKQEVEIKIQYLLNNNMIRQEAASSQQHLYDVNVLERLIREATEQLTPQQKQVFELQRNKELSYQEIADQLGISRNTVRNHMVKALQFIRTYLGQRGEFFLLLFSAWYFF